MAKLEGRLYGDFGQILEAIDQAVMQSVSASLEEASDFAVNDCLCAVRVYERYSFSGGNRLSLSVTLFKAEEPFICPPLRLAAVPRWSLS